MQYVYVLRSTNDKNLYIGCTNDLKKRVILHNSKKIPAIRERAPFQLIYYEAYLNKYDAFFREKYLKTGWGRNYLKKTLRNCLTVKNFGG